MVEESPRLDKLPVLSRTHRSSRWPSIGSSLPFFKTSHDSRQPQAPRRRVCLWTFNVSYWLFVFSSPSIIVVPPLSFYSACSSWFIPCTLEPSPLAQSLLRVPAFFLRLSFRCITYLIVCDEASLARLDSICILDKHYISFHKVYMYMRM